MSFTVTINSHRTISGSDYVPVTQVTFLHFTIRPFSGRTRCPPVSNNVFPSRGCCFTDQGWQFWTKRRVASTPTMKGPYTNFLRRSLRLAIAKFLIDSSMKKNSGEDRLHLHRTSWKPYPIPRYRAKTRKKFVLPNFPCEWSITWHIASRTICWHEFIRNFNRQNVNNKN